MFRRILLPLDGSKFAGQVFLHVAELAGALGSEIFLVGVCEPEEKDQDHACRLYINSEAQRLKDTLGEDSAVKVTTEVLTGKPAEQILSYAKKNDIDLIMLSSHGRSGIMRWLLGSTVNKIVHKTDIPLIIVRAKEPPVAPATVGLFRRILIPLDASEKSAVVLPYVVELTRKLESEVILFEVVEPGHHVHTISGLDYVPFKDRDIDVMKTKDEQYLDSARMQFAATKAIVKSEVRIGDSAEEIIKFADEADCRLIALASHVHSGIEAWFYGSVTHKILQAASQSVLWVPSPGARR